MLSRLFVCFSSRSFLLVFFDVEVKRTWSSFRPPSLLECSASRWCSGVCPGFPHRSILYSWCNAHTHSLSSYSALLCISFHPKRFRFLACWLRFHLISSYRRLFSFIFFFFPPPPPHFHSSSYPFLRPLTVLYSHRFVTIASWPGWLAVPRLPGRPSHGQASIDSVYSPLLLQDVLTAFYDDISCCQCHS